MFGTLPYDSPLPNQVKLNYPPIQQARQIAVNRTIKHRKINKQKWSKSRIRSRRVISSSLVPLKARRVEDPNHIKLSGLKRPPIGVAWKLEGAASSGGILVS
ncbi:hypothetical protein TNCV_3829331 [Trichonephila clavipes]|nr:hypothetical protein TNCV_3829331 [Trichonephila clavipes]